MDVCVVLKPSLRMQKPSQDSKKWWSCVKMVPLLIILAWLNNWIQERTGNHSAFLHLYCRPAVICSQEASLAVCCWVCVGNVRWQNRALSPMPPLLIRVDGGKFGESTGRIETLDLKRSVHANTQLGSVPSCDLWRRAKHYNWWGQISCQAFSIEHWEVWVLA